MSSKTPLLENRFSHIYIEKAVTENERTKEILSHFPQATLIYIDHYKDVFCRSRQNLYLQHKAQALILAGRDQPGIYPGAQVCQSFGNEHFYYASIVMNCIYNCEYCYLKGMYTSGHMVIFVNVEDTFAQVEELLKEHDVYLCLSYDTDLMPLENITGFIKAWCAFTIAHPGLRIEIRTKCGRQDLWQDLPACDRVIFAFTLSPESVAASFEHGAGSLSQRIKTAALAQKMGFTLRLCFDPMIYVKDFRRAYGTMLTQVAKGIDLGQVLDISVGSFRISAEYMKKIKRVEPASAVVQFPFENIDGVYQYPAKIRDGMEQFLIDELGKYISKDKIFTWE